MQFPADVVVKLDQGMDKGFFVVQVSSSLLELVRNGHRVPHHTCILASLWKPLGRWDPRRHRPRKAGEERLSGLVLLLLARGRSR